MQRNPLPRHSQEWRGSGFPEEGLGTGGVQDVLVYFPTGGDAGGGVVLSGTGDGSPLAGSGHTIPTGNLADGNGDNPLEVADAYAPVRNTGFPDLITITGDATNGYHLDYSEAGRVPAGYDDRRRLRPRDVPVERGDRRALPVERRRRHGLPGLEPVG